MPPTAILFPPRYDNRARPELVYLPVPRGLPQALLGVPIAVRAEIRDGFGRRLHGAAYEFELAR